MVWGAVIQQPPIPFIGIDLPGVGLVVCGVLGQNLPKHAFVPSLTVSLAPPHG